MSDHQHAGTAHAASDGSRALTISLLIVIVMMVIEVVGGVMSNSLALIGDAGHMLVDGFALGLSLFAFRIAKRPATVTRTFGFHRVEIMAALTNGVILVVVTIYILYEAYQRFLDPPEVRSGLMLIVAVAGLVANLIGIWLLRRSSHANLNIRGAFLHIVGDTISSVGVIIGGIIISITGWGIVDPIIAVIISLIIVSGAYRLIRESSDILLEAVPKHVDVDKLVETIKNVPGVVEMHDVHIWTITSGILAMSSHLIVQDTMLSRTQEIISNVNHELAEHFGITHTTLQLECEKCETCSEGLVCQMSRPVTTPSHEGAHGH
jgi:cobalt-zinc-cadmium efflux system protein